jgi:hypothetical protein
VELLARWFMSGWGRVSGFRSWVRWFGCGRSVYRLPCV